MWFLQRKSDGKVINLLNKEYTVGRRNCTIELSDDLSVSRLHLKLNVDYSSFQNSGTSTLKVMDLGSTYGVFINPDAIKTGKIEPKTWVTLDKDSTLHFGVMNEWIVKWRDISVICSGVGSQERKRLIRELGMLGAKLLVDWQEDVTHLVTESIVLTQKVLDSLLAAKPIVVVDYFESCVKVLEDPWCQLPDVSQFVPSVGQALVQFDKPCFLPKEERKSLFAGKTFIFSNSNEAKSSMALAVSKAGGKVTHDFEAFYARGSVLVDPSNSSTPSKEYVQLLKSFTSRGERSIPMKEIGLAILSCSVKNYCNPLSLPVDNRVPRNSETANETSQFDQETQVFNFPRPVHSIENAGEPPSKRSKIQDTASQLTQVPQPTPKRSRRENSASDVSHLLQPPSKKIHLEDCTPKATDTDQVLKKKHSEPFSDERTTIQKDSTLLDSSIQSDASICQASHLENSTGQLIQKIPTSSSKVKTDDFRSPANAKDVLKRKALKTASESLINESKNHHEEILGKSLQTPHCSYSNGTSNAQMKPFSSTQIKREMHLNEKLGNVHNRSHWHGRHSSPKKSDTSSKFMVKSSLIRPELKENGLSSQRTSQSPLKEKQLITRIRSMKIACFKEGKWTKINK